MRQRFDEAERKCLLGAAERELFETALQMRETSDVVQLVERDVKAPHLVEKFQKTEVRARLTVNVEFDVGPVDDEIGSLLQLRRRQRLTELNDLAIRLQRPERVADALHHRRISTQEAPTEKRCTHASL